MVSDPRWPPTSSQRKRRNSALEVFRVTGERLSHGKTHFARSRSASECKVLSLVASDELHHRIDATRGRDVCRRVVEEGRKSANSLQTTDTSVGPRRRRLANGK